MDYDSFVTRLRITRSYLANHPTHGSWEEAGVVEQAADAIVALRSDLAAAQALLGEVREWIPYYRWIPDLRERVDAIIGKKTP